MGPSLKFKKERKKFVVSGLFTSSKKREIKHFKWWSCSDGKEMSQKNVLHVPSVVLLTEFPLYHERICRGKKTRKENTYSTSCTVSLS